MSASRSGGEHVLQEGEGAGGGIQRDGSAEWQDLRAGAVPGRPAAQDGPPEGREVVREDFRG